VEPLELVSVELRWLASASRGSAGKDSARHALGRHESAIFVRGANDGFYGGRPDAWRNLARANTVTKFERKNGIQLRESFVAHPCLPAVVHLPAREPSRVAVEFVCDHEIEDGIAEEGQPLVAVRRPAIVSDRRVGQRLDQALPFREDVPDFALEGVIVRCLKHTK